MAVNNLSLRFSRISITEAVGKRHERWKNDTPFGEKAEFMVDK
jgi:hypothetical protein